MTQVAANVRKRSAAVLYTAPTGTAAPTAYNHSLNAAFVDLGYALDEGIEEARDRSTTDIKTVGGTILRTVLSESSLTYKFTLLETRKEAVELFYGTTLTAATGLIDVQLASTGGTKSFVFDFSDGSAVRRVYIASGEVTEVETVTYGGDDADAFGVTITCYPVAGVVAKIFDSTLVS